LRCRAPGGARPLREIEAQALQEAKIYRDAGVDGLMLENMHDTPYLRGGVGPEIVAAMAVIARAVKDAARLPCGVQVLAAANQEAVAVALAAGLDFIRAEGFAFAQRGRTRASSSPRRRSCCATGAHRRRAGAVWADVKKKHSSHAITADVGIGETAHAVEFMRGDAVIVTGTVTGDAPKADDVREVKRATKTAGLPRLGCNRGQCRRILGGSRRVSSSAPNFKAGGHWSGVVEAKGA